MKSPKLLLKSPGLKSERRILRKSFALVFAGAMALGLSAGSVLAQGPYYPQVNPVGGAPFVPNGIPILSSDVFNLIESKMVGGATLITPPVGGNHTATAAEYTAAVKEAAKAVAQGSGGTVTIVSLAGEVALYRSDLLQVQGALTGLAQGIAASSALAATKQALLKDVAFSAATQNPGGLAGANTMLTGVFSTAAADVSLASAINDIVLKAVQGAGAGSLATVSSASIYNVVANAATAVAGSVALIPKAAILTSIASTMGADGAVMSVTANLDALTNALTTTGLQTHVTLNSMVSAIRTAVGVPTSAKDGAIAQGALRVIGNRTGVGYTAIKSGLGNTTYVNNLVDSFSLLSAGNANAGLLAGSYAPDAVAAAASVKYPAQAGVAVGQILDLGHSAPDNVKIVTASVNAYQAGAAAIATAAVGRGTATVSDVTSGATLGAQIGAAGAIARAVVIKAGLTVANAQDVAASAIAASATIAPAGNQQDAFADITFNLANALKTVPAASTAAVTTAVNAVIAATTGVPATAPTYIAVIGALAGDQKANFAAILTAGLNANAFDNDAPTTAGANLVSAITNVPLNNYQATLTAASAAVSNEEKVAVLYAASLSNSGDAAGGLAVLINNSANSLAPALLNAAISANRSKLGALSLVAEVALAVKANPDQIQVYVGRQVITNPTALKEIATAATVVAPQFSHFIAHAVAFNKPKSAHDAVEGIFLHSKITIPGTLAIGDRPAAGAAITAGLATGILESTQLTAAERKTALQLAIVESVRALVNPLYNDATAGPATFRQSDGFGGVTLIKTKGVAGGITGFVAQLVNPGDTSVSADLTNALTQATYAAAILTGTANILDIAQAAGQAYGWVSGTPNRLVNPGASSAIAAAITAGYPTFSAARVLEAVRFGVDEAAGGAGLPGAGAGGLRLTPAQPFYDHHSASGNPVSNIFTL